MQKRFGRPEVKDGMDSIIPVGIRCCPFCVWKEPQAVLADTEHGIKKLIEILTCLTLSFICVKIIN